MINSAQFKWENEFSTVTSTPNFKDVDAQLVLVFADRLLLNEQLITETKNKFKTAEIVYCSSSGNFSNEEIVYDHATITAISFESTKIKTLKISNKELLKNESFHNQQIEDFFTLKDLHNVLVFSEGSFTNGSDLIKVINNNNPNKVSIFGGMASDLYRFEKTYVGLNTFDTNENIIFIGFISNNLKIEYGCEGGWHQFGPERIVTKSDKNVLFQLNDENALDLYKSYLGDYSKMLPASSLYFPLSVNIDNNELVRTVLSIDDTNKTMTFAGDIPEGSTVRFMKSNNDMLLDAAQKAVNTSPQKKAELIILISCIGRQIVLGNRHEEELDITKEYFGPENTPTICGFYSYGEIAPDQTFIKCNLYNQTITIMSIYED